MHKITMFDRFFNAYIMSQHDLSEIMSGRHHQDLMHDFCFLPVEYVCTPNVLFSVVPNMESESGLRSN